MIQILLGVMRVGRLVSFTPYSVISGFMSGIGVIIILLQTLPLLGADVAAGGPRGAMQALPKAIESINFHSLAIAAVTLAVGVLWPRQLRKYMPPTLAALIAGTLLGVFWLTGAPAIGNVPTGLPSLHWPDFSLSALDGVVTPALTIALLDSIDSLLTSLIVDTQTRASHNPNKELVGQGIANTVAGFIGALPGAGNTLSTLVNFRAGGRTPVAGVLLAGILIALTLGLGSYVEALPRAVLAGILLKVGWDIIDWRFITRAHRVQREHLIVMLITMGLTVFLDLVTAVAIGLIAAGMTSARQFERLEMDSVVSVPLLDRTFLYPDSVEEGDDFSARVGMVALQGSFSVASSTRLINTISPDIHDHEVLILDFSATSYVDDSAALMVEQLVDTATEENTPVIVMGLSGLASDTLRSLNVLRSVPENRFVADIDGARQAAIQILG